MTSESADPVEPQYRDRQAAWMILHPRLLLVSVTVATTWGWTSLFGVALVWQGVALVAVATAACLLAPAWHGRALRRYALFREAGPGRRPWTQPGGAADHGGAGSVPAHGSHSC